VDPAQNPFSPQDAEDGRRFARIFFDVGSKEVVKTLRVLDVRGQTLRVLMNNDAGEGDAGFFGVAAGSVTWDGRDQDGRMVPLGVYIVLLQGTDPVSGNRITGRDTVVVGKSF
jgi:hypothetical protein